jgi:predicted permease
MLQSFRTVLVTPGIDADRVAFIRMKTNLAGYPREQSAAYFREVIARVEGIAGVQSVSMVQLPPVLAWQFGCGYRFTSGEADSQGQELCALFNMVSTNFFETVGAPIISGRSFQDADLAGQPAVAVVSETFARRLWAGRNAVGSSLIFNGRNYEVIGVASYLDYARADGSERPFVFFPSGQPGNRMLVRVEGDAAGLLPLIRQEVSRADPNVPISEELTLAEVVESMFMPVKLATTTLGYAGVLALLLSVIGLYGVLSDSVQQRRAEIGIRMAIGARPGDVRNQMMYEALRLVIGGVALGLPGAYAASRLLTSYLYGVAQFDLLSFSVAPTILVAVALAATYVPAKRAAAANPLDSLRCD